MNFTDFLKLFLAKRNKNLDLVKLSEIASKQPKYKSALDIERGTAPNMFPSEK